jgi:hypothetical protein
MGSYRRLAHRGVEIYQTDGLQQLLSSTRAFIRTHLVDAYVRAVTSLLPVDRPARINDVAVPPSVRPPHVVGDEFLPFYPPAANHWWTEAGVAGAHAVVTNPGDDVVHVGGGFGVTAVHAARHSKTGTVTVYEADPAQAALVRETLALNEVPTEWAVREAAVGPAVFETYGTGEAQPVDRVAASDLPACDVLELDCEGSELSILEGLTIRPRAMIVEIHHFKGGFDPTAVLDELDRLGYRLAGRHTHAGAALRHEGLVDKLHHRVRTEAEGLPPIVTAVREEN